MEQIPNDLLYKVFEKLDCQDRRCVIPLVCKSWEVLVCRPCSLWRDVTLDMRAQPLILASFAHAFFRERAGVLETLSLWLAPDQVGFAAGVLGALGESPQLQCLRVAFSGAPTAPLSTFMAQLGWAYRLKVVQLRSLTGRAWLALHNLRRLPLLEDLELSFVPDREDNLPRGFPQPLLDCTTLRSLTVEWAGHYSFRDLPNALSRLSDLRRISFAYNGIHWLGQGFQSLAMLECLKVVDDPPMKLLCFPANLSGLHRLREVDVSSREVPVALGSLPGLRKLTLRQLRPSVRRSHDPEQKFRSLLEPLELAELSLLGGRLGSLPGAVVAHASLTRLEVVQCGLCHLPAGPYLAALRALDLRGNRLRGVPEALATAPALTDLQLGADVVLPLDSGLVG